MVEYAILYFFIYCLLFDLQIYIIYANIYQLFYKHSFCCSHKIAANKTSKRCHIETKNYKVEDLRRYKSYTPVITSYSGTFIISRGVKQQTERQ